MTMQLPNITDHFIGGVYERVFFEPGEEAQYVRNYLDFLDGEVEYEFRLAEYFNLRVIGLTSPRKMSSCVESLRCLQQVLCH